MPTSDLLGNDDRYIDMRQGSNSKRPRGKGGNRGGGGARNVLTRSYDSNGPAGRVRGNPHQVLEKYLSLARDAQADDPILAENLLQHADHYFRVIAEAGGNRQRRDENRREDGHDQAEESNQRSAQRPVDGHAGNEAANGSDGNGSREAADDGAGNRAEASTQEGEPAPAKRPRRQRRPKAEASSDDASEVTSDAAA